MTKSLVIVESPAKARTISKYLGSEFIVESSVGHIRDLPKKATPGGKRSSLPKDISAEEKIKLKKINDRKRLIKRMGIDPDNEWKADWQIIPEKEKVLKALKKAARSVEHIYLATDLDREGEAIAWHLKEVLGSKYNYSRIRFNQITKTAILDSFSDPKEIDLDLVKAYRARRFLDKVIGFELSPLLWKKIARGLSAGRVQSVALRVLDERERSIQEFIPEEFWEIKLDVKLNTQEIIQFNLVRKKSDPLLTKVESEEIQNQVNLAELSINEISKKPVKVRPKPPFITSTLQQSASTRLNFNVKRTMRVAQKLYEAGYITYMRTDAPSLSETSINDARNFVKENLGEKYLTIDPRIYSSTENAQDAHEAIRPTNAHLRSKDLINLSDEETRLYQLIWERFIASQLPDAEYLSTSAKIIINENTFVAKGREVIFDGYTNVFQNMSQEENILPSLSEGDGVKIEKVNLDQKHTKPPSRFSEAALVRELEKKGIGRPSTYANIISTIQDRGYVEIQNKRFFVKKIGHIVAERLLESFDDIMDYDFTANLENSLDEVANGNADWKNVLDNFYKTFQNDLISASDEEIGMRPGNIPIETDITCNCCKTNMVIRNSSNGVFLGCSGYQNTGDDKCKETLNLISGDEAVSVDDTEEAQNLLIKKRCSKCGTSMDNYLIDEQRKLHVCGKNPDCDGYLIEDGQFKIKGYDGPTLECHKCGSEMQLKTGRFGKYFACLNDNCGTTRALQRNGEPKPITMEPIELENLKCLKCEDHYLLRDSMKGLFLAASQYPKNRETRAPKVFEINKLENEIREACKFLPNKDKHLYLLTAPEEDSDGNPYVIRYNRTEDTHYLASEKDGKKTKWTAIYSNGEWVQSLKSK
ncbi:MAG: DNA topoisomerase I subunit omega [Gammaproteobacteria bacterium]|nr:DNA topoisomerase I subunit omega [Gammaproteobacteria bacterium]|tara:strand:+ start:10782 stop:13400 length:2619 start_codon:yes stop_codon:yes gene_type:complete